jgi:hypothetical protein
VCSSDLQDWDNWDRACDLHQRQSAIVCVFINTDMLDGRTCGNRSYAPNHWVALANVRSRRNPVDIDFFTWGGTMPVKVDQAHEHDFQRHYYGYVSAVVP